MNIPVIDQTGKPNWSAKIQVAADNWNRALADGGRAARLSYVHGGYAACGARVEGAIVVCDSDTVPGELGDGGFDYDWRPWKWGYVRLFMDPAAAGAVALVVHELGHCLGLNHVPNGTNSVMTVDLVVAMTTPTPADVAGVLPYLDTELTTTTTPSPGGGKHKKHKKHKKRH